ncbi:hypothetical protein [Gimesia algae]|uniref:DUF3592 domain-containing protein n=1 Tax=Gimesia algae TaxID=2527971 RepID=A0A517V9H5_9PLAN|nr:hypothetical protein [Gimesia algae]QDT89628.1 hypothetical protein Pan161_12600 [Gimesia algae]
MIDEDEELKKLKWILIAVVAFLISGYLSFKELKYTVWGATTEATVTNTFDTAESRRKPLLAVEYTFTDEDGKHYSERDDVPIDWPVPGPTVNVQYLPGVEDSSRLEGHSSKVAVWVFLSCCVLLCFAGFKLYQMASEAVDGPPRRRRK